MANTSLNQEAWLRLFEKYRILQEVDAKEVFTITAAQIKEFREPRLMTKFDHACHLPPVFEDNKISILPLTRGTYVLGQFEIFHALETNKEPLENLTFASQFETLDFDKITSETTAISCVYVSKILEDFLGEEVTPTVSGRMSSGCFEFEITKLLGGKRTIDVDRAQIEIDAGYEGVGSFALLEAKNYFADDFVIRQLYYPYRKWQATIKKRVRNLFLTYSNGVFELREYDFLRLNDYNSIRLVQCKKYAICNFQINFESIQEMLNRVQPEEEPPGIPFPQADSFERVLNLCELLDSEGLLTKEEVTENYGFDSRQTDYYTNACKYLGLVVSQGQNFVLSEVAKKSFKQHIQLRRKFFIEQLLKRRVFKEALSLYFKQAKMPTSEQLVGIMKKAQLLNKHDKPYSQDTLTRRTSTVRGWVNWVLEQIEV